MKVIDTIGKFCGKYMALLTIVFAAAAFLFTDFFKSLASVSVNTQALFGSHMASLSLTNILLGVIMFGMGMTLKADDFKEIVKRPKDVIIGIFSQYIVMSGLAFLLAKIFALDAETAIGLMNASYNFKTMPPLRTITISVSKLYSSARRFWQPCLLLRLHTLWAANGLKWIFSTCFCR